MSGSLPLFPSDVGNDVVFGAAGPRSSGVCFHLRLPFRDETAHPPTAGQYDHEWTVPRAELDEAERDRRLDQVLVQWRAREERVFLKIVEMTLRWRRARLERIGGELVLRRVGT